MATFAGFCADVCAQVRNKLDRPAIFAELTGHLEDRAAGFVSRGLSRDEARDRAVAGMGDPAELGRALDRVHGPLWYRAYRVGLVVVLAAFAALVLLAAGNHAPILPRWVSLPPVVQVVGLEGRKAVTGAVTGGGVLGDYNLTPRGAVYLIDNGEDTHTLAFALCVSHAQPWLPNLQWENLTVTVEGPNGPLPGHVGGDGTGGTRLVSGQYAVYCHSASPTPGRYTVTLGSGMGSVGFVVDFAGEGDET